MLHSIVVHPAPQTSALGTKVIMYHTQVSSSQARGFMYSMWYRYQHIRKEEFLHFTVSTKILQMNLRSGFLKSKYQYNMVQIV